MESMVSNVISKIQLPTNDSEDWQDGLLEFQDDDLEITIGFESRTVWNMERGDGWTAPYGEGYPEVRNVKIESISHDGMELPVSSDTIHEWEAILEDNNGFLVSL